jgi:serine/threonine protein kinase
MNIVHRDLKPDNIVFINKMNKETTPGEVDLRIIDFGLAAQDKDYIFKDWANIGTFNYMAP